ncbi:hypothetical protein EW146_g4802 [Bondarzewia mesenterica]|uniref:Uncharacterized protein n=1 Tax=Bondarzewia mesenterica TaxID=1095465 RepID=A0A4S4LTF4_9AGAM|nr:hypothetical protein EW146_g4802 [Bondarzewia mesenterica]
MNNLVIHLEDVELSILSPMLEPAATLWRSALVTIFQPFPGQFWITILTETEYMEKLALCMPIFPSWFVIREEDARFYSWQLTESASTELQLRFGTPRHFIAFLCSVKYSLSPHHLELPTF